MIKQSIKELFKLFGIEIRRVGLETRNSPSTQHRNPNSSYLHSTVSPFATLSPWLNDESFLKIYKSVQSHTLVDIYRCYELWVLAKQSAKVSGEILEVGVWRGGTGAILAEATKELNKTAYLCDTFAGVVKAGPNDNVYKGGEHSDTSLPLVAELLRKLGLSNTRLLQGIFPEDTQHQAPSKIAMLHCDVDVYTSTKDIVEWCLPRMGVGATIVFDDYGFDTCEGVAKYCDELKLREDLIFTHNLNGHAVFFKIA